MPQFPSLPPTLQHSCNYKPHVSSAHFCSQVICSFSMCVLYVCHTHFAPACRPWYTPGGQRITLRAGPHFPPYSRQGFLTFTAVDSSLAGLHTSRNSPVSASLLSLGALGISAKCHCAWLYSICVHFVCIPGILRELLLSLGPAVSVFFTGSWL